MSLPRITVCALSLSLMALASTASAQRNDTFQNMSAGYAAAMGRPAGGPSPVGIRVVAEFFAGGAAAGALGGVGLVAGGVGCGFEALDAATPTGSMSGACQGRLPVGVFAPAYLGIGIGAAAGVTLMGDRLGGGGAWWGASLGAVAGSAAGLALVSATDLDWRTSSVAFLGTATLGAVIGYELSTTSSAAAPVARTRRVMPVASLAPGGAQLGLVGTF
jgi:hypothetical protein